MNKRKLWYMDLIVVLVVLIWGINTPVVKIGYKYVQPLPYNTMRLIFAAVFMWITVLISRSYKKVDKSDIKTLLMVSLFGFAVFQFFFTIGVNMVPAANASLILAMMPISVIVINRIFKIESITLKSVIGIIFSFIGVFFIVTGSGKGVRISLGDLSGIAVLLTAQFAFAYYTIFSKPLFEKYSVYQITAYVLTISTILFIIFYFKDVMKINWAEVPASGWASNLYSGIGGMCVGNSLWSFGVKKIGSARSAMYLNLQPVFTIIVSYLFLGESFGFMQFIGAVFIFAGLYVAGMKTSKIKNVSIQHSQG